MGGWRGDEEWMMTLMEMISLHEMLLDYMPSRTEDSTMNVVVIDSIEASATNK